MAKRGLIVGCGYTGLNLALRLLEMGLEVTGTTRSDARGEDLARAGINPLVGDLTDRDILRKIDRFGPQVVFYLVPPQRAADDHLSGIIEATARAPLEAFVYGSSTSVYGNLSGEWVDESMQPQPSGNLAKLRHAAERALIRAQWEHQTPGRICRISGIYGPGRTLRRALANGEYALIEDNDTWVNRIHVEDLVGGLVAAWKKGSDGRVYNLVDDEPHRASQFAYLAADLQDLPRPRWISLPEAKERYDAEWLSMRLANRRVSNARLKEDLGMKLKYPSYRDGLPTAVQELS